METSNHPTDTDSDPNIARFSEIAEYYAGCNVLLTGGSGFVGQLLIEKLLRSCPKIRRLYLILRSKKGKSSEERYNELFSDCVYDRLKEEQPDFQSKVIMIEGEFNQSGLSISLENRELIKDSHIVLHGAATVRFDDKLRFAVNINVRGTKEILLLCRQMPNLKAIVYIGTAFSHCVHKFIDEVFYEPPMDCDKVLALLDILDDKQLESLTPTLVGEYPNTYAFSKSTAEDVVLKYGSELPICIVRPSIMVSTEREPVPGWINNIYGPTGATAAAGIGLLHFMNVKESNVADIIPADYVINNIIASAWNIGTIWEAEKIETLASQSKEREIVEKKPPIYNSVTSAQNPITWGKLMQYTKMSARDIPSSLCVWYYFFSFIEPRWLFNICIFAFHIIPAAIVDSLAWLTGRKPTLLNAYKKIHKFTDVMSYFGMQQWKFRNENVLKLWDKLSPMDRKIFYLHVGELKWIEYYYYYVRGIRVFLLKDPMSNLEQSNERYFKLTIIHYTVGAILLLLVTWLFYALLSILYSSITV